jgi:RNA recognition motif-containing protein
MLWSSSHEDTTLEEITAHYQEFGEVIEAYIPADRRTGKGRGFAFVTMKDDDAAHALDETNGALFQGRKLVVSTPLRKCLFFVWYSVDVRLLT